MACLRYNSILAVLKLNQLSKNNMFVCYKRGSSSTGTDELLEE